MTAIPMVSLRALLGSLAIGAVALPAYAAGGKEITLRFTPKENITANVPKTQGATGSRTIDITPLADTRTLADLSLVGENRERSTPRPVTARSSVAEFSTAVLKQCLGEWGVKLGKGDLVLRGEITNLLVTEDQTYSTAVSMRFRLEDAAGMVLWEGIVTGDAHQWGRSFEEENYNEQISDALKRTYANLVDSPGFQKACAGQGASSERQLSPAELKAKILEMMKAGFSDDTIETYARRTRVSHPPSVEELVEWKKAGIGERVIKAVLEQGP
jgi:hypothetical protein